MPGLYQQKRRSKPDLSPAAISKEVTKKTIQKPYVLYPLAAGLLGGLAAVVLEPSAYLVIPAIIGALAGAGAWIYDMTLRRQFHAGEYLKRIHAILESDRKDSLKHLELALQDVEAEAELNQLQRLQAKYDTFEELLRRKLNPGELSFNRYLSMAEQVFLAALDNLKQIADIKKSITAIDEKHIRSRIDKLGNVASASASVNQEREALTQRLQLLQHQRDKIQTLITRNEAAMTKMDEVMAAITGMHTANRRATMDMEDAMMELERLAQRSADYSKH